jgi:hypothetical protein
MAVDVITVTMVSGHTETYRGSARVRDGVLYITGAEYHADTLAIPLVRIASWKTRWG